MAVVPIIKGFMLIPEGTYVFKIVKVKHDEDFGKIEITLKTSKGLTHIERFSLKNKDDTYNERALSAFSYFAKTALDEYNMESIEVKSLVGHYIKADVKHTVLPSTKDPNKTVTFVNLGDKSVAHGFEDDTNNNNNNNNNNNKGLDLDSLFKQ